MNDKDNKSDIKGKSIIESIEDQFDEFFAPKKLDEASGTENKTSAPGNPPVKKVIQNKLPPKPIIEKVTPKKVPVTPKKAPVSQKKSPTQVKSDGKTNQQKFTPNKKLIKKKTLPLSANNSNIPSKQETPAEIKEASTENTSEITVQNVFKKANEKHKKIWLLEKAKQGFNHVIFVFLVLLLVILSMFNGVIMDSDALLRLFNKKNSSTSTHETASIRKISKKKVKNKLKAKVLKEIKAPDTEKGIKDSNIEKADIQQPNTIEKKEVVETIIDTSPLREDADEPVDVIKEDLLSYPYSVYLGSYNSIEKIKAASSVYSEKGITSYWTNLDLGKKGVWFRHFVGYFQTREEADDFIKVWQLKDAESKLTKYTNLIGIYRSKEEIDRQKARLEEKGYNPYIISDSENVYRLYIGAFYQKDRAEELKINLEANGIISELVER